MHVYYSTHEAQVFRTNPVSATKCINSAIVIQMWLEIGLCLSSSLEVKEFAEVHYMERIVLVQIESVALGSLSAILGSEIHELLNN